MIIIIFTSLKDPSDAAFKKQPNQVLSVHRMLQQNCNRHNWMAFFSAWMQPTGNEVIGLEEKGQVGRTYHHWAASWPTTAHPSPQTMCSTTQCWDGDTGSSPGSLSRERGEKNTVNLI